MKTKKNLHLVILFIIAILTIGCGSGNDLDDALASIEGEWRIERVTSLYATFTETSFEDPTETILELALGSSIGSFTFTEEIVDYSFTRNDTLYSGTGNWELDFFDQKQGFNETAQHTLSIENQFTFEVTFGDGTRNSEINASTLKFRQSPPLGEGVRIELELERI